MYVAQQSGTIVSRHQRSRDRAARALQRVAAVARKVCSGSPSRTTARSSTPTSPTRTATSASSSSRCRDPSRSSRLAPPAAHDPAPHVPEPQRRRSRGRRRQHALHRRRRRRWRRRHAAQRAEHELAARQDPAHQPQPQAATRSTRSRPTTRSRARPASAARSGCTACATRGGSRSTARTHDLWIGDVGQGLYEEIDYATAGPAGHQLGLEPARGLPPVQRRRDAAGRDGPAARAFARRRRLRDHRWLRVPRRRRSRTSTAPTCSATRARASCARSRRRTARSPRAAI